MEILLHLLLGVLGKTTMKKDSELPWAIRILRWGLCLPAAGYAVLSVVEKFISVWRMCQ